MRKNSILKVAFDLKRLADYWDRSAPVLGITRYVKTLHDKLQDCADLVNIVPLIFAMVNDTNILQYESIVKEMRRLLNIGLQVSWQHRNRSLSKALYLFKKIGDNVLGIEKTRTILSIILKNKMNYLCEPSPFSSRMEWDIYHSPFGPLPSEDWTGTATRVLTIHDCIYHKFSHLHPGKGKPAINAILESINVSRDYIICVSENTRKDVMSIIPIDKEHTHVIPEAHELLFTKPRKEKGYPRLRTIGVAPGKYILALGQISPRKNIIKLAQAFGKVQSNNTLRNYCLLLVTSSIHRKALYIQLKESGVPLSSFKIIDNVDDETLAGLYACAAAFAYVSLYEGFGIPLLEAMAGGCPVVASNTSSIPEVVGDAAEYVDPISVGSIATGLTRVLEKGSLREALIVKGKEQAAKFRWEKTVRMTLDFYQYVRNRSKRNKACP